MKYNSSYNRTKPLSLCLIAILLFTAIANAPFAAAANTAVAKGAATPLKQGEAAVAKGGPRYEQDEVIVVFEKGVSQREADGVVEDMGGEDDSPLPSIGGRIAKEVELPEGQTVEEAVESYNSDPDVAYAQPNYIYTLPEAGQQAAPQAPNDSEYDKLWHFNNIFLEEAWDILDTVPHTPAKVAVLDTAVLTDHEDLQANFDKSISVDVTDGDTPVPLTTPIDFEMWGHGTHVTGILGATANNSKGIAGVGAGKKNDALSFFFVKIYKPLLFTPTSPPFLPVTETTDIVKGIDYAKSHGANVINISGGYSLWGQAERPEDRLLKSTVDAAASEGVTVVCASGNQDSTAFNYPADIESAISVISNGSNNQKSESSNYGIDKDISAPGDNIYSTLKDMQDGNYTYGYMSGTSMAAPVVTGVVSMLYSVKPDLTVNEVKDIIYSTATDTYTPGWDQYSGHGIINAKAALEELISRYGIESGDGTDPGDGGGTDPGDGGGTDPGDGGGTDPGDGGGTDPGNGGGTDPGNGGGTNTGKPSDTSQNIAPGHTVQPTKQASSFGFSQKTVYIQAGKKARLPYVLYSNAKTKQKIGWRASKPKIASIKIRKAKGKLSAAPNKNSTIVIKAGKKLGKSRITLTAPGGAKARLTIKVVRKAKKVRKSSVKILRLPKKKTLLAGQSKILRAKFTSKATAIATWKSSNKKVATIDAAGKLTALRQGSSTITLKAGGKKRKVVIVVK
jgi:subtilisin family serine protease